MIIQYWIFVDGLMKKNFHKIKQMVEIVKGLKCKFKDKQGIYIGYVSRIYKTKLFFVLTNDATKMMCKGSRVTFDIKTFKKMINNECENIESDSYL